MFSKWKVIVYNSKSLILKADALYFYEKSRKKIKFYWLLLASIEDTAWSVCKNGRDADKGQRSWQGMSPDKSLEIF